MKIGVVLPWFPSQASGELISAVFVYRELKKMVERGNEVAVITVRRAGMPVLEVMDGITVYRFSTFIIPKMRYEIPNFFRLTSLIASISDKHKLDLVVFFTSDFLTSVTAICIKRKIDLPVVVVVNGLPGISWFSGSRTVDSLGWAYTKLIGLKIIKAADGLRLLQSSLSDELAGFGVDRNKLKTILNGVDIDTFYPRPDNSVVREALGLAEDDFMVLYVGRLVNPVEMKGTRYLIEAVASLLPKYSNLRLVFVGDGDGRKKIEKMAGIIGRNAIFTGYRSDTYRFMSAADVFVLPSLAEGCPNVVLEASACGTPVIASKVGAVPELIEDGKTGIIVSPKSVVEIRQALARLIEDPPLRLRMGKGARERMEKEFTVDAICQKLEGFYQEVVERYNRKI